MKLFYRFLWIVLIASIPAMVYAQGVTTASIRGIVTDSKGEPLPGANVVAKHLPTGTVFGAATRTDGRFNIANVRVGGPYQITVTFIGYKPVTRKNVYLSLGEVQNFKFTLIEEALQLGEVTVVGERNAVFSESHIGTATSVSTEEIERLPTIQRSIQDFARLTPQVVTTNIGQSDNIGGMTVAGKNNRENNFQVDGAILNDAFGLAASHTPGGQANLQPISLDAIQEFQVSIAPYDVRQGAFAGGLINAITRSGTNQFKGSAYFFGRNESFVGDLAGQSFKDFDDFNTGFRLGGPLAQNKAFFFINGEIRQRNEPNIVGINDPSAPINFPVPKSDLQRIIDIAKNKYGYDPGGFDPFTVETNDVKLFGRLDINLSNQHRLTLRHNYVNGNLDRGLIRSSSLFTLESNQYKFRSKQNSTVLQLNSTFANNLANEARVSLTFIRDKRDPLFGPFPQVLIEADGGDVRLGVERFSQANALDQDIFEFTDNLLYFVGNHAITLGTHNEFFSFDNLFIQDFFGNYEFHSIDDFEAGKPFLYSLSVSKTGNPKQRAQWNYFQLGFYAQDEWRISPRLNLTYGLRADIPIMPDDPLRNTFFESAFPGFRTDRVPNGNVLWSPRVGFNYDVTGQRTTQIRGGVGLFAGLPPGVWLSNQYSNTGVDFFRIFVADFLGSEVPDFSPDPFNQPLPPGVDPNARQTTEINVNDPDFKMPQVLRTNIGIDQQLTRGFIGSLEFLYSKNINDVFFKNINIGDRGKPVGTLPDGRPDYGRVTVSPDFTRVIVMDNTSKGFQWTFTAQVQKQLGEGILPNLFGSLSYTYMQAEDVNSGRSSRAISNWRFNEVVDPNNPGSHRSDFEIRHRILGNLSYKFNYAHGFATTVSVFYEGRSGRPFNYIYRNDVNGDGQTSNDLVYVPASPDDIIITKGTWDDINTFIESDEALRDARGRIIERNAAREPWVNQLDLRIAQQVPTVSGQKFEITLDVLNVLNLLNSDWGHQKFVNFQSAQFLTFNGFDQATGKPMVELRPRDTNGDGKVTREDILRTDNLLSRWQIQLGVRYSF